MWEFLLLWSSHDSVASYINEILKNLQKKVLVELYFIDYVGQRDGHVLFVFFVKFGIKISGWNGSSFLTCRDRMRRNYLSHCYFKLE